MPETKLIVGLGQGLLLRRCRHAIGATLLDDIAEEWRLLWRLLPLLGAYVAEHRRSDDGTTVLVWPLVQYNISGAVVAAAARRYSVESRNVVVLHDDLDTKVGVLKWRHSGSAGGNGVKSVIGSLGTDVFSRVRVGVGRPASKEPGAIIAFVLGDVPDDDLVTIRSAARREGLAHQLLETLATSSANDAATPTGAADQGTQLTRARGAVGSAWVALQLLTCAPQLLVAYVATLRVGLKWLAGGYSHRGS